MIMFHKNMTRWYSCLWNELEMCVPILNLKHELYWETDELHFFDISLTRFFLCDCEKG